MLKHLQPIANPENSLFALYVKRRLQYGRKISGFRAEKVHEQLQNHLHWVLIRQGAQTNPQLIH
jgi:hypothetical protein